VNVRHHVSQLAKHLAQLLTRNVKERKLDFLEKDINRNNESALPFELLRFLYITY